MDAKRKRRDQSMKGRTYAYQNRSLENISGEKWKDIPNLEGYFMISNLGRIKRMEYVVQFADGRIFTMKPMIMKPWISESPNFFKNDNTYFLRITLTVGGTIHNFSIARMQYYIFIKRFDLNDEDKLVVCKNGDGQDVRLSNLSLLTRTERTLKVIQRNRHENILLRPGMRKKATVAYRKKYGRQISCYNKNGKIIETYPSVPDAAEGLKISKSSISNVLHGRKVTAGGFFWRFGKLLIVDIQTFLEERDAKSKLLIGKEVTQYNMKGERIAVYQSLSEASRQTGILATVIGKVTLGLAKSAGGFFWVTGKGKKKINLFGHTSGRGSGSALINKKVSQYSVDGKLIATYPSLTEAARKMGRSKGGLTAVCKGYQKTFAGFLWKYSG